MSKSVLHFTNTIVLSLFIFGLAACTSGNQSPIQVSTFTPSIPTHLPSPLPTQPPTPAPTLAPPAPTLVNKPLGVTIKELRMLDGPNGWAVGEIAGNPSDLILRTSDGGTSWHNFTPGPIFENADPAGMMATAYFLSQYHAWVVYTPRSADPENLFARVWHTADGGQTWKDSDLPLNGINMDFFAPAEIGFSDWQNGWVMAHLGGSMNQDYIAIFITQDGGSSWQIVVDSNNSTLPGSGSKEGVTFLSPRTGWVAGNYNGVTPGLFLWRTRDGGITWQRQMLPVPDGEPGDLFIDSQNVCGVTAPNFQSAQAGSMIVTCTSYNFQTPKSWLYVTFDGGQTWNGRPLPGNARGNLFFLTPYQGWYLVLDPESNGTGYKIYRSDDSGINWQAITPVQWNGKLQFLSTQVGWGVVTLNQASALVKTTNGGFTWEVLDTRILP